MVCCVYIGFMRDGAFESKMKLGVSVRSSPN